MHVSNFNDNVLTVVVSGLFNVEEIMVGWYGFDTYFFTRW